MDTKSRAQSRVAQLVIDTGSILLALGVLVVLVALGSIPARADTDTQSAAAYAPAAVPDSLQPPFEYDRSWLFRVYVDDKPVGFHGYFINDGGTAAIPSGQAFAPGTESQPEQQLYSIADFEYKLLFVTVYEYFHRNQETWEGGCLRRIESSTDANGKPYSVLGQRIDNEFVVEGSKGTQQLDGCVKSFAYWNPEFLNASRLLNTQNGEYLDVVVSEPETDTVMVGGQAVEAKRYRLTAKKLDLQLWYSVAGDWLALQTSYENGRTLRYERVSRESGLTLAMSGGSR